MLTIFALPKPFRGHFATIQRNAIRSWVALQPQCQIILFGDEEGTAEVAREFDICHIPEVAKNQYGTPLLNSLFEKAEQNAKGELLCYVNCDILLMSDFIQAVDRVSQYKSRFLMVGQCWNLDIADLVDFDQPDWEKQLHDLIRQRGEPRGPNSIDFFVFPRDFYSNLPPLALGRAWFDQWLIWQARALGATVVDITSVTSPIHQNHDYSHVAGGKNWAYEGDEAQLNLKFAGGKKHLYQMHEATHRLTQQGCRINLKGILKLRVLMEQFGWPLLDFTRQVRHPLGLRKK